jgi:hypothetical protein
MFRSYNEPGRVSQAVTHDAEITKISTPRLWLPVLVFLAAVASSAQMASSTAELKSPDLNLILQRLQDVQHQDPAQSRPYEVTREYKVFRGYPFPSTLSLKCSS